MFGSGRFLALASVYLIAACNPVPPAHPIDIVVSEERVFSTFLHRMLLDRHDEEVLADGRLEPDEWGMMAFLSAGDMNVRSGRCQLSGEGAGVYLYKGASILRANPTISAIGPQIPGDGARSAAISAVRPLIDTALDDDAFPRRMMTLLVDEDLCLTNAADYAAICKSDHRTCQIWIALGPDVALFGPVDAGDLSFEACVAAIADQVLERVRDDSNPDG